MTIFVAASALAVSCTGESEAPGKAFDELPVLQEDELWAVFYALPDSVMPEEIKPAAAREAFKAKFTDMQDGVLGDGEGFFDKWSDTNNSIYWIDYFSKPEDYVWSDEEEQVAHQYINLHVYAGADTNRLFAVVQKGAFLDGNDNAEADACYWFDKSSKKMSAASLQLDTPYTEDQITEDALLLYGSENLYYAIKNKKYSPNYVDRGFKIYIDDVGECGIHYEWDGTRFVRNTKDGTVCLYNYGFGNNIIIGKSVPFSVPGYKTEEAGRKGELEIIYNLIKEGEDDPALIIHADNNINITEIEVCSGRYSNIYNIHPGMKVSELMSILAELSSGLEDPVYTSILEDENGFVVIYHGFDEDFAYKVKKEDYLGNEQFKPEATIARVTLTNAVG